MRIHSPSTALARFEGEDASSPLAGNALELVNAICQVIIGALLGEVQSELVHEDVNKLYINTTKVLDHISARLDSIKKTVPSAVVLHKVAQLQTDVNYFLDGRYDLSNELDPRRSRISKRLALSKQ